MKKPPSGLTLVKFGGALITDKSQSQTVKSAVLQRLVSEIASVWPNYAGHLIIGHGQGSFAHIPAQKYQTLQGFTANDIEKRQGAAIVHDLAAQLNRIVLREFLQQNVPAVSWQASGSYITSKSKFAVGDNGSLSAILAAGFLPVTGGDVMFDTAQHASIWSTEEVFEQLVVDFIKAGQAISQVVYVTEVAGLLDEAKNIVPKISTQNWQDLQKHIGETHGIDVTGGMKLKIEHCLRLAELGIQTKILSGAVPGNMTKALLNQDWIGTEIEANS